MCCRDRSFFSKTGLVQKLSAFDGLCQEKRPESEAGSQSSKSFELLKINTDGHHSGSNNNGGSGHTSGDDLETFTTTSSDIEVISSPGFSEKSAGPGGGSPVTSTKRGKTELVVNKHFKKGNSSTSLKLCLNKR
jgi:hypothetical protein